MQHIHKRSVGSPWRTFIILLLFQSWFASTADSQGTNKERIANIQNRRTKNTLLNDKKKTDKGQDAMYPAWPVRTLFKNNSFSHFIKVFNPFFCFFYSGIVYANCVYHLFYDLTTPLDGHPLINTQRASKAEREWEKKKKHIKETTNQNVLYL